MVKTEDNRMYKIQAPDKKLQAGTPKDVRFYVRYDPNEPPPQLVEFRLNAKTVCVDKDATTQAPPTTEQSFTSPPVTGHPPEEQQIPLAEGPHRRPTDHPPPARYRRPSRPLDGERLEIESFFDRPVSNLAPVEDDDGFFMGDFSFLGKNSKSKVPSLLEEQCGIVIRGAQPLITYGQASNEGEFPWHAALYHSKGIDLTYICGATLISRHHLVTVAHCVTRTRTATALVPSCLMVYLGKFFLKLWSTPGIQDKQIQKIYVHQKYNPHSFDYDIAILKLSTPAEITDYVRPVCLWEDNAGLESIVGKQGTVVGWGFDETGKVTEELTKAHMPVVSQETCIYSYPEFYSRFTSERTYCAGFNNGTSVCNGDSGGGMVFPRRGSTPYKPVWELRGMVSISVALQNRFECDSSHYVVFTDTAKFLNWIYAVLSL